MTCPNCGSDHIRRGGMRTWTVYVVLIALAIPGVLLFHLHGGLAGAVIIAAIVLAHLLLNERVCLDCGTQWRGGG
jgi:hypothetical protein